MGRWDYNENTPCVVAMASPEVLFQASLPCGLLKDVVKATKTTNPVLTLGVGGDDQNPIRFWCRDPLKTCAVTGMIDAAAMEGVVDGGETAFTIQAKLLSDTLGMLNAKTVVTVQLSEDENGDLHLGIGQTIDEERGREFVSIQVEEADEDNIPYDTDLAERGVKLEERAVALVDLAMMTKYLASKKASASTVTLRIGDGAVSVESFARKGRDLWQHPSSVTDGKGDAELLTKTFHAVVNGAKSISSNSEVFILDRCVRVETVDKAVGAQFYIETRRALL